MFCGEKAANYFLLKMFIYGSAKKPGEKKVKRRSKFWQN